MTPVFCAVFSFVAASVPAQPKGPPERVSRVETGRVAGVELAQTLNLTGSLEGWRRIELSGLASGLVQAVPVEEGGFVQSGQTIAELDSREAAVAVARARAELEKAQAERRKLRAGRLPQEVQQAERALGSAEARFKAARDEWDRMKPLAERGIVSKSDESKAKSEFEVAEAETARARAALDLVEVGFRTEEIQAAEAEVKVRQAAVDDAERRLADRTIVAPIGGVVTRRLKEPGEWTAAGETVAEMVVLDPMRLRVEVPQARAFAVKPGQAAGVEIDGLSGRTFRAEITGVIPRASEDTRNFPAILRVENPEGLLADGMFARVELRIGDPKTGLEIPREAVQYRGERLVVYRVHPLEGPPPAPPPPPPGRGKAAAPPPPPADSLAREVEVRIVAERQGKAIVEPVKEGGLSAGEEIVVLGGSRLRDGSPLSRIPPAAPGGA